MKLSKKNFSIEEAEKLSIEEIKSLYKDYVNPKQTKIFSNFPYGKDVFVKAKDMHIYTSDNKKILDFDNTDGFKYILDAEGSWLLIRFSGTEPLLRIYAECQTQAETQNALTAAIEIMGINSN